jgi:Erv1 / Alr family
MLPEIWGACGWKFLHIITLEYPEHPTESDQENYYEYFLALKNVLPCAKCRQSLACHLKKYPLTSEVLSSRTNLVKWGIDLHNVVNYYLGKPMLGYIDALNEIRKYTSKPKPTSTLTYVLLLIIVIIIVVAVAYYYYYYSKR